MGNSLILINLYRLEIFMIVGIILFWLQLIVKVHLIGFLHLFPSRARFLILLLCWNIISSILDVVSLLNFNFQVLNETSLWWFNRTQHITSNAVVSVPDKNVTIAKKCSVFPVEFVGECILYSYLSFCLLGTVYTNVIVHCYKVKLWIFLATFHD